MDAARNPRVVLIAPRAAATAEWRRGGNAFDMLCEPDLAAAAALVSAEPPDAVVLDTRTIDDTAAAIDSIRRVSDDTPIIILSDRATPCDPAPGCVWVHEDAPASTRTEVLWLAIRSARLARELERSEARFRDVIERNADALVVIDENGTIVFANRMAADLFGQSGSLIGTPFGFPAIAGETTELDIHTDGHARVVEMRVVMSEWEGRSACIASLRDITHRKQAEEIARGLITEQAARSAAESAARRFRFLAESSSVLSSSLDFHRTLGEIARLCVDEIADWAVVYIVDDGGRVRRLAVSHCDEGRQHLAVALRESAAPLTEPHPVLEVLDTHAAMLVRDVDDGLIDSLSEDPRQVELIRALGIASFMVVPLTARDRSLGAIALISADADRPFDEDDLDLAADLARRASLAVDNARLYRTAQEVNQTKSDLFAAISHDLRTPLNSIIGHADLLTMGIPEKLGEASLRHVERIGTSAAHLVHLIDELLTLVRLDAGREELNLEPASISSILDDVGAVVELLAEERGLRFSSDLPDPGLTFTTDASRLRQVLLNLVGNAIKYTDAGSVRLEVEPGDEEVIFRVHDTGVGIAPQDLEKMFEPFWQADSARQATDKGTGLGLAVVQRLVQLLGGRIDVRSEPGRGSTFCVVLPRRHPRSEDGP